MSVADRRVMANILSSSCFSILIRAVLLVMSCHFKLVCATSRTFPPCASIHASRSRSVVMPSTLPRSRAVSWSI